MKYGKRAISLALAAVLLAGSLAGTPAEAAEAADVLYLPYYTPTATASQNEGTGWVRVRTGEFPQKYNLINQWGEPLLEADCEDVGEFSEGLLFVRQEGRIGFLDQTGALAISLPEEVAAHGDFHEGAAYIRLESGRSYFIDRTGAILFECPQGWQLYPPNHFFSNGLIPMRDTESGFYGYLDQRGDWVIPPQFDLAGSFEYGYAWVQRGGHFGVIDQAGKRTIPCSYTFIRLHPPSADGGIPLVELQVEKGHPLRVGLARASGELLVEPQERWTIVGTFAEGRCPIAYQDSGRRGIIDDTGKELSVPDARFAEQCQDGLFLVWDGTEWSYLDRDGTTALTLPPAVSAQRPSSFFQGMAVVSDQDGYACAIDRSGSVLFSLSDAPLIATSAQMMEGNIWVSPQVDSEEFGKEVCLVLDPRLKDHSSPWAEGELARAKDAGLVTESCDSYFTFRITRRRFAELMANLVEKTTDRTVTPAPEGTFTDTDDLWVRKAAALGIVNGFGDGRFSPNGYINREQVAAALCRAVRYIEGETGETILPASADLTGYADADQVSPWAADSMAALTAAGLLQGTSGATLSPKDTTTVEQAILLALRAWQAFAP